MKYQFIIERLDNGTLFSPASIAQFAMAEGLLEDDRDGTEDTDRLLKQRIRVSMGRYSNNHEFPDQGDGLITLRGNAPTPGWFGWRWKAPL